MILDGVGCLLLGAHLPWSETAVHALLLADPAGNSAIAGWDRKTSSASATLLNSSFIQGFELDDYFPRRHFTRTQSSFLRYWRL